MVIKFKSLINLKSIIITALVLRLIIALLGEHGDVIQYYYWSKDIYKKGITNFYDRNIDNAERPNYPPVTYYLFWGSAFLQEQTLKVFWVLNTAVPIFPSNLILWMESEKSWYFFNKFPNILSDLAIIALLYNFSKNISPRNSLLPSIYFAFLPPFWYNSSLWGQTDTIFALPMLASFYMLSKNNLQVSSALYILAILAKPTSLFALPVYIIWWFIKSNTTAVLSSILIDIFIVVLLYLPFHPQNLIFWLITFYQQSLQGRLDYLVANAFNFWSLIYGFKDLPETSLFLKIPANIIGNTFFTISSLASVLFIFIKRNKIDIKTILLLSAFVSFSAFMFLPKMHERYFYPVLILLLPLIGLDKKIRYLFLILSAIHLVNLYHGWYFPEVDLLVELFSNELIIKLIILLNIIMFFLLGKYSFQKSLDKN